VGCRQSSEQLIKRLEVRGLETFFICDDDEHHEISVGQTRTRAKLAEALQAAEVDQAKALIAIEQNDEDNLQICCLARQMLGVKNVLSPGSTTRLVTLVFANSASGS
jgi:Trk K+ transport system NAD-binding subunit